MRHARAAASKLLNLVNLVPRYHQMHGCTWRIASGLVMSLQILNKQISLAVIISNRGFHMHVQSQRNYSNHTMSTEWWSRSYNRCTGTFEHVPDR